MEPVDASNHIIMDYSIHDAIEAGFNHVVFIIRKDIEKEFKEVIGERIASICASHDVTVDYAFQDINDIPGVLPEGRTKPWGTGQAVLAAKNVIDTPFIVINAKVARAIKTVFYALDVVNQGMQEKQSITVRCVDIENLEKQAEAIRVEQIKLYESYADGVLLRDAYIEKKKALSEKLAVLQDSIRTEKEEQECADELDEEIRALTKQASEKTYIGGLTKECVDAFVSMVYLYDDQTMKIEFNCEDVIRRALEKYGA